MEYREEKGSNFYMLTAQILNDKNLNHAEKITMAILNGLSREDGTCYPSNEWLANKLDLHPRKVQEILESLQKNNYIRREIISCANNPFKKYRIIHTNTNFKLCLRDAENGALEKAENGTTAMPKTACIIDKKELIDKKEEPRPSVSPPSPPAREITSLLVEAVKKTKPDLKEPNLGKWETEMDRMLRIDKRNVETVKKLIEWLPSCSFWSLNILSADKFREQFDKLELKMNQDASKSPSLDLQLLKKLETRKDLIEREIIVLGPNYVEFPKVRDAHFRVGEPSFKEKVLNSLRKCGVPIA